VISLPALGRQSFRILAVLIGVLVVIGLVSTTCAAPERRTLPPPSPTSSTVPPETTIKIDHSRIALPPVGGATTTTLAETGSAAMRGVVVGPDGNVGEAIVRIERLVGEAVQVRDVRAAPDGTWEVGGIPGGRVRVRAFLPPAFTMLQPEIFFLPANEVRELRLVVTAHRGPDVRATTSPRSPFVGDLVNLAIRVTERVVDDQGVARTVARSGIGVEVRSSGWEPVDARPVTDGDGIALFTYRCDRASPVTATAYIGAEPNQQVYPLEVPPCGVRPTTTTTTSATTTAPGETTTTNGGQGTTTSSTTTTTQG
jgi:hypothetical protein